MDAKHFVKKRNEFKNYLKKHGISKEEIEKIFSIEELTDKLDFQFYDIDERKNSENNESGFEGVCSAINVKTKEEEYKEITFESDADLFSKTVNGRVVGIDFSNDTSLSIFIGSDYISFAETTIKNQYYNGIYTGLREIYHYDIKDNEVDFDSREYLFEGKSFDMPIIFFDEDITPISFVSHMVTKDREEINLKGDAVTSLGITYNLDILPEMQRHEPSEVKYVVENDKTKVYLDNVCYDEEIININKDNIENDFEDRYYLEDFND